MKEAGVGEEEFRGQESEAGPEGGQVWAFLYFPLTGSKWLPRCGG